MASTNTVAFVVNKSYGPCTICKQELTRGTIVKAVRLTGYQTNTRGYAHARSTECLPRRQS